MRILIIAASLLICASANAQSTSELALQFPDASVTSYYPTTIGTDSYNITPNVDIAITSLCYYDRNGDGLTQDHPVAIYESSTRTEIGYTVVTSASPLVDNFRCEPIVPVVLNAGVQYQVGGFTQISAALDWAYAVSNLGVANSVTYDGYTNYYNVAGDPEDVVFSANTPINIFFFGPNFLITTDVDGDGVEDDMCPDTTTDESGFPSRHFGRNRNLLIDGIMSQNRSSGLVPSAYSVAETNGCSCQQILDACDAAGERYGNGHYKFGCSNSVIERWATGSGTTGVPHPDGGFRCGPVQ